MFQKYTLSNGVRLVVENIPYVKSVTLGFWIEAGSIHEEANNNGITHFVEHMIFKGTDKRSAREIAESFDSIGGQLNAFTSKECTCFYAKVLDTHLSIAIDVLTDMVFHSSFNPEEIEKEKSVVLEEINMYEDSPEDLAHELLSKTVFKHHKLGMPVLGTAETVSGFDRKKLVSFIEENYTIENMVISVAGNFDENQLIEQLEEKLSNFSKKKDVQKPGDNRSFNPEEIIRYKDIEQLHICLGLEGTSLTSKDLYPLLIVNNIFGGSMSSRLFQNIREDKGLAYSVFSYPSSYKEMGLLTVYAGINPNQLDEVLKLINYEIKHLKKDGLTNDELFKSKEQLKGSYMLGLESTSSRMSAIGKSELLMNHIYTPKEILEKINQVTMSQVRQVIDKVFVSEKSALAVVGKLEKDKNLKGFLDY